MGREEPDKEKIIKDYHYQKVNKSQIKIAREGKKWNKGTLNQLEKWQ